MTASAPPPVPHPRVPWWLIDAVLIALMVPLTVVGGPGERFTVPEPAVIVLVALAAVALPLRRRWPRVILGVQLAIYAVAAVQALLLPAVAFAIAVCVFRVASRMPRRVGVVIAIGTVVLVVGLGLLAWRGGEAEPRIVQFALIVFAAAAIGDATRSRREYIEAITDRAERAERTREAEARRRVSEERLRIARDLHDTVAHRISVISLNAGVASGAVDDRPEKAKEALAAIRSAARTVLGEIGSLLQVLRSDDDSATAPGPGLASLDELIAQFTDAGLDVTLRTEGDLAAVSDTVGLTAYRVIQEALTNAHKHGAEHRAHVLLAATGDALDITVTNPTDPQQDGAGGARLGLAGMRERVATVRGTVETGSAPGGWRVRARLPLSQEDLP